MKRIFTITMFFATLISINAQRLVDVEFKLSLTKEGVSALTGGTLVPYGVDLYKVTYLTADVNDKDHVASGLMCVPADENTIFPLACYQHGTVAGRDDVPSNLAGGFQLAMIFSAFGYVVCAPDFVGLGDSPGIHPYVHAKTEAYAGIDFLRAARELDDNESFENFDLNDQLFIGGYSQGGHAAMALHREIETNLASEFTVTASAPMSGPYSVSESMVDFTLSDNEYGTVAYLAWLTLGYKEAYPTLLKDFELEDMFKAEYIDDIKEFRDENITLWELNDRLIDTLTARVGGPIPKEMLNEDILNSLLTDPTHPLSVALADNDTYDWAPQAPTNLYYCVGDDQVTFENAILAERVMKENGATEISAIRLDTDTDLQDHGGCVFPAATGAIFFFAGFQEISTSTIDLEVDALTSITYGNDQLYLDISSERSGDTNIMSVYSQSGQLMLKKNVIKGKTIHDISHLQSGMYVVILNDNQQLYKSQKLVKF